MNWYRVLWVHADGEGRWTDVQAAGPPEAAWIVCQQAESQVARFEGIQPSPLQGSQVET